MELFVSFQPVLQTGITRAMVFSILSVVSGYNFLVFNRKE